MKTSAVFICGLLCDESVWASQIKSCSDMAEIKVVNTTQDTPQKMVEEILDQAPPQFALAGHSMGGWLALEVMKKAKDRVTKLCLLNTTAKPDTEAKQLKRHQMIQQVKKGKFPEVVQELVNSFVYSPSIKSQVEKMLLKSGAEKFIRQENAMLKREECFSVLPTIQCPTLVVHATMDQVFHLDDLQEIADGIPKANLAIIEECGHMSLLEKPDRVNTLLSKWLKS